MVLGRKKRRRKGEGSETKKRKEGVKLCIEHSN